MLYKINTEEKIKWEPQIIRIDEKNYIKKIDLEKRGNSFTDIIFYNNNKEIFIGRYETDSQNIRVLYKDGRIIVYSSKFIKDEKKFQITQVHTLYDILDDICYFMEQEELLKLFDENLDASHLKKSTKFVIHNDIEKRHRLIK